MGSPYGMGMIPKERPFSDSGALSLLSSLKKRDFAPAEGRKDRGKHPLARSLQKYCHGMNYQ
ncbi:hypothetical protein [Thermotalea metallivorans]|uniref:Uncharacterized protein n=1 Tax=Thermotalea metallivorans TaxID=520762 RepID=A0A140L6N0_9FIRM|nr:hypothetical protein [Thermotalea metallivorans]KXG76205.1 hypothetical protein AN619_11620 [Thermotalea metallivorans]